MPRSYVQIAVYKTKDNKSLIQDIIQFQKADLFMKNGHPSASGRFLFERMIEEAEAGHKVVLETGFDNVNLERLEEIATSIKHDLCLGA
jgi:hypothetical protein